MTAATPSDSAILRRLIAALFLAVFVAVATLSGVGCNSKTNSTDAGENPVAGPKGDPWKAAASRLRNETDLATVKQVLSTLTSDISQKGEKLPTFTNESLDAVAKLVPLSPEDREELNAAAYTSHDPVYIADCFYLRDAARSLALPRPKEKQTEQAELTFTEKQADAAFAWVCREVYLRPWSERVGPQSFRTLTLPPTAVLRRGHGSGLERMYVFLALLQQLELNGCLIGGPKPGPLLAPYMVGPIRTAADVEAAFAASPRGPFWAVGVRVGNDVRLFDPWRGQPFPMTLNQLKANPDAAKAWFEDKANIAGVTLDDAKNATVFLAVPVNSLSPRMAMFESKLKGEVGGKFAYDLKAIEAMRAAFPDPKPAFWNPPDEAYAYGRASRSYLPLEHGGSDRNPQSAGRLYESSIREQIPGSSLAAPADLIGSAQDRIRAAAAGSLLTAFIEAPNPRERIQRGQFQDAAMDIVSKQEGFAQGLERLRTEDATQQEKAIRDWVDRTNVLYHDLTHAQTIQKDPNAAAAVMKEIDNNWRQRPAQLIIDRLSAEVGRAEASFLLALCKHEQAERLQTRLEQVPEADTKQLKRDALNAWRTAQGAWRTYSQHSSAHAGFPGRAAHAQSLSDRADKFMNADAKK